MAYEDQFQKKYYYYNKIDRLVSAYKALGYVTMVKDWERSISKIADYPDLRRLAIKADFLYHSLKHK